MFKVEDLGPLFRTHHISTNGLPNGYNNGNSLNGTNRNNIAGNAIVPLDERAATVTNFYRIAKISRINYAFYQMYESPSESATPESSSAFSNANSSSNQNQSGGNNSNNNIRPQTGSSAAVKNAQQIYAYEEILKNKLENEYNIKDIIFFVSKKEIFIFQVEAKTSNDEIGFNQLKDAIDNIITENKLCLKLLSGSNFDSETISKPQLPPNGQNNSSAAQNSRSLSIIYTTFLKSVQKYVSMRLTKVYELPDSSIEILAFGNQLIISNGNRAISSLSNNSTSNPNSSHSGNLSSSSTTKRGSDKKRLDQNPYYLLLKINPSLGNNNQLMLNLSLSRSFKFYNLATLLDQNDMSFADRKDFVIYICPSGVRCSCAIKSSMRESVTDEAPTNFEKLFKLLLDHTNIKLSKDEYGNSSHFWDSSNNKRQLKKWIKLIPNLNHMNGLTPRIATFLETFTPTTKYIMWPLELCFVQFASGTELELQKSSPYMGAVPQPATAASSAQPSLSAPTAVSQTPSLNKGSLSNVPSPAFPHPSTPLTIKAEGEFHLDDPLEMVEQFIDMNERLEEERVKEVERQKQLQKEKDLEREKEREKERTMLDLQNSNPSSATASTIPATAGTMASSTIFDEQNKMDMEGMHFDFYPGDFSTGMSGSLMNDWMKTMNDQNAMDPYAQMNIHQAQMVTSGSNGNNNQNETESEQQQIIETKQVEELNDNANNDDNDNDEDDDLFNDPEESAPNEGDSNHAQDENNEDDWDDLFGDLNDDMDLNKNEEGDAGDLNDNQNKTKTENTTTNANEPESRDFGVGSASEFENHATVTDANQVSMLADIGQGESNSEAVEATVSPKSIGSKNQLTVEADSSVFLHHPPTGLYEDPGAPSPVPFQIFASPSPESQSNSATDEKFTTPKDPRKSIFAPLNFNPLIEKDIDSKYSTGGKFFINSPAAPQILNSSFHDSNSSTPSFMKSGDLSSVRNKFPDFSVANDSELDESSEEEVNNNDVDEMDEDDDEGEDANNFTGLGLDASRSSDNEYDERDNERDEDDNQDDNDDDMDDEDNDEDDVADVYGGRFSQDFNFSIFDDNSDPFVDRNSKKKATEGLGIVSGRENISSNPASNNGIHSLPDQPQAVVSFTPSSAGNLLPTPQMASSVPVPGASNTSSPAIAAASPANSNEIQNWLFWIIRGPQMSTFPPKFLKENPTISKESLISVLPYLQDSILFSNLESLGEDYDPILQHQKEDPTDLTLNMRLMLERVFPGAEKVKLYELLENTTPLKPRTPFQCLFELDDTNFSIDNDAAEGINNNHNGLDYRLKYEGGYSIKNEFDDPSFATTSPLMNVSSVPDMNDNMVTDQEIKLIDGSKPSGDSQTITNTTIMNSISQDSLFHVPSTLMNVKRIDQNMTINETSLNFWKILHLQPINGEKNFRVVMVTPKGFDYYMKKANRFLNSIIDTYRSCKFGNIQKLEIKDDELSNEGFVLKDGILEIDIHSCSSGSDYWDAVQMNLDSLALSIQKEYVKNEMERKQKDSPILLFMVSPFGDLSAMINMSIIIDKFTTKLNTFIIDQEIPDDKRKKRKTSTSKGQPVQQITKMLSLKTFHKAIAIDVFFSRHGNFSICSMAKITNICMSLYNLFPNSNSNPALPFNNRSTFTTVSRELPKKIFFMLTKQPIARNLIADELFLHLCYERSIDKQWCVASWTDQYGRLNYTKSWYIGENSPMCKNFEEVSNEIFDVTLRSIGSHLGKVYVLLTRLNNMIPDDELTEWKRLSMKHNRLTLIVLTVELESSTLILSEAEKEKEQEELVQDFVYGSVNNRYTVGSTASMMTPFFNKVDSPELNMASPSYFGHDLNGEFSPDALSNSPGDSLLIDLNNDVHAIIFQATHPLSNQSTRMSLRTGFLYNFNQKLFEVNLLSCHSGINSTELLKTILVQYKNLAQMANVWGLNKSTGSLSDHIDLNDDNSLSGNGSTDESNRNSRTQNSVIPWHVLAVRRTLDCLVHIRVN